MKKLTLTIASLIAAALIFTGGVYASQWLNFTGDEQIEQSDSNVEEIMQILRNVNEGKITAEEANAQLEDRIAELEDMNPSGLAKQNKELREQVKQLEAQVGESSEYVTHLEEELQRANESVQGHHQTTQQAVEEARTIGGE
ncbi:MAG: hypothetical protein L0I88_01310 [Alkalibacterium sp.]|nr:hypothetical protein [Alkalibacterium sp.]